MAENKITKTDKKILAGVIASGGVAVIPTDTIYGIVGSAGLPEVVERIYKLRRRNKNKPMIVLLSDVSDLEFFGVRVSAGKRRILSDIWPGRVSAVLPVASSEYAYLHRGTKSIAFRVPAAAWLRELLAECGPVVAPSANIEGEKPARNMRKAARCFGDKPDLYLSAGTASGKPSTLVSLLGRRLKILREGAVRIDTSKFE